MRTLARVSGVLLLLLVSVFPASAQPRRVQSDAPSLTPEVLSLIEELPVRVNGCNVAGNISCGQNVSGTANSCNTGEFYIDFWVFNGVAGQPVTATVSNASTLFDVLVAIQDLDGTGEVLKSSFARGGVTLTFTPTISRRYTVTVGYVTKFYSRSYDLRFTCGSSGGSCQSSGFLQRGVTTSGSLSSTNACNTTDFNWTLFQFSGTEGVPVRISGTATFPLYMEANSVGAKTGAYKMSDLLDPGFVFYPERTGTQELWISHDGTKTTGQFTVTVVDEPLAPCRRRVVRH